jgi:hypothetical protein
MKDDAHWTSFDLEQFTNLTSMGGEGCILRCEGREVVL